MVNKIAAFSLWIMHYVLKYNYKYSHTIYEQAHAREQTSNLRHKIFLPL